MTAEELKELKFTGNSFYLTIVSQRGGDYFIKGFINEFGGFNQLSSG